MTLVLLRSIYTMFMQVREIIAVCIMYVCVALLIVVGAYM